MQLLYFAWLRQKIGKSGETIDPPAEVATVGDLIAWLKQRGPGYADALKNEQLVRVAVNREYVGRQHPLAAGDEIGLFPPVTGG